MGPLHFFDRASQQTDWLMVRMGVISRNIANANTPGYLTQDIEPFSQVLDKTALSLATTSAGHLGTESTALRSTHARPEGSRHNWDVYHSGNSVTIEEELLKMGEGSRQYALNTAAVKKFHSLILSSARGPG